MASDLLTSAWQGGAFVAFRREDKAAEVPASTGDLALLYVSWWKTPQAAERFAHLYAGAVSQRYHSATVQAAQACSGASCPVWMAQITTEEGPAIVEHWYDNSAIISESFDAATAAKLSTRWAMKNPRRMPGICRRKRLDCGCLRFRRFRCLLRRLGAGWRRG